MRKWQNNERLTLVRLTVEATYQSQQKVFFEN